MVSAFVQLEEGCQVGDGPPFDLALVSRRSAFRQGTRFTRRGIDRAGQVANFVETEQLVATEDGQVTSHVQVRGSIPVFWSSPTNLKYTPPMKIEKDRKQRMDAFNLHVDDLTEKYGDKGVIFINLIDKKKDQKRLGKAFDRTIRRKVILAGDSHDKKHTPLSHVWFDFHAETKGMKWGHLQKLVKQIEKDFDEEEFFHRLSEGTVVRRQEGVARTNCVDCLDRTNVVQALLARRTLLRQLRAAGAAPPAPAAVPEEEEKEEEEEEEEVLENSHGTEGEEEATKTDSNNEEGSSSVDGEEEEEESDHGIAQLSMPYPELELRFRDIWGNNADHISKLYSGTRALKGDFTRTGRRTKRGVLDDGWSSAKRYLINNFKDGERQQGVDLLISGTFHNSLASSGSFSLGLDEWADALQLAESLANKNESTINGGGQTPLPTVEALLGTNRGAGVSLSATNAAAGPVISAELGEREEGGSKEVVRSPTGSVALGMRRLGRWGCLTVATCIVLSWQSSLLKHGDIIFFSLLPKICLLVLALLGQSSEHHQHLNEKSSTTGQENEGLGELLGSSSSGQHQDNKSDKRN